MKWTVLNPKHWLKLAMLRQRRDRLILEWARLWLLLDEGDGTDAEQAAWRARLRVVDDEIDQLEEQL